MRKNDQIDIDSEQSQDLKDEQLMALNRHFKNRRSNRNSKFAPEMQSLYKQALMNVIFGQFEQASKKLKHLITLYPDNPDSFHLLATIHQQIGQEDKAVQYSFMHTYLSPPSLQKWVKVADMSFNLKMYTQAAYCYGRALKIENYNIQLLTRRAEAFQLSYQSKKAISTYKKILAITKSLVVLKKYAKLRFKRGQYSMARQILTSQQNHQHDPHLAYMISETFLKQEKYQQLLQYVSGYVINEKKKDKQFNIDSLLLQFIKLIFICLVKLRKDKYDLLNTNVIEIKKILLANYEESSSELYQDLITYLKGEGLYCQQIIAFLLQHKPHKTVQNYLLYTQFLKDSKKYDEAIKILNQSLIEHRNSVQLTSQLNHIKVISGKWKNNRKKQQNLGVYKSLQKNSQTANYFKDQDIFYSDQENENEQNQNLSDDGEIIMRKRDVNKQSKPIRTNNKVQIKSNPKKQIQTQDPEIIKKLLINCKQTVNSILNDHFEDHSSILGSFRQVQECVQFVISLTSWSKQQENQQKDGLFNRKHRRRRYFSSRKTQRHNSITRNLSNILQIISNVVQFMKVLIQHNQFTKAKHLAQILSKAYFFRWQNKSVELKKHKQIVYQIGLLSCLHLKKYQTAVFFIRYLAHKQPQNCLYLLIVNYLIHNSQPKICMNSLLSKYNGLNNNKSNQAIQQKNNISEEGDEKQSGKNNNNIYMQEQYDMFGVDQDIDSYPRKMSNASNLSNILRDNVKLSYLFGIQYMQTSNFDLAISSFAKIINLCQGEIKKNLWLCLTSCFLQISSSRTCHAKLSYTNRSSYCLWQYLKLTQDEIQSRFNKARWFAQIRMNDKAITQFEKILQLNVESQEQRQIQIKSAYCLICIFKQMQNWQKVNQISRQYFSINPE